MLEKREYQEECLTSIAAARLAGAVRVLIVMATRLGKTITAALDVQRFAKGKRIRVLYLCHKNDILYQARLEFQRVFGTERTYGFFHGTRKDFENVDFLFSSFDTLSGWLEMFDPRMFDYVIVDESHHSHAETYLPTIEYFKPKFLLAITATPNRMDEKDITEIYGKPVYNLPLEKALALGYLAPVDYRILTDEIQTDKIIETPDKRWSISALNRQIFVPKRDEEIVRLIGQYTRGIKDLKMIVFCSSVKHCDHLVTYLPDSLAFHSHIPGKERDVRLEMFRQEMLNTVITVDCFNEGIDIPRANVIVFLRSTASDTIFLQQLGRGLTKEEGKERVLVLDFVANLERIEMVDVLVKEVERNIPIRDQKKWAGSSAPLTIEIGKVSFHEKKVAMNDLLDRIVKKEFYPTWEEAAEAARKLGITKQDEHEELYRKDQRLPRCVNTVYSNFPGWRKFLDTDFYPTWQEAGKVARELGATSLEDYLELCKKDRKLCATPVRIYPDYPGFKSFLKGVVTSNYPTLKEASKAARKLGATDWKSYLKARKKDQRLPCAPNRVYSNFPGMRKFLGLEEKFYLTWQEAGKAARNLGITGRPSYDKLYKKDSKLPSNPEISYSDFPGWDKFMDRKGFYPTWQEAGKAARKLGIHSQRSYKELYKGDDKLPSNPDKAYSNFPGFLKFIGKK